MPPDTQPTAAVRPRPLESGLATALRMVVHGVTALAFAWPLTHPQAVGAAGVGAAAGALAGRWMAGTRMRLPVLHAWAAGILLCAVALRKLVVGAEAVVSVLGPVGSLVTGDAVLFGVGGLAVAAGLRATSTRHRPAAVLEVAAVAIAFGQLVVAHRHGSINRPFPIADPIIAQGGDPTVAFLAIGAVAAGVIVLLLLSERSPWRSFLHLGLVVLVLLGVVGTTRVLGLPPPPPSGEGLGLRPDGDEGKQKERSEGERGGRPQNEQLEFRDDYSQASQRVPVGVVVFRDDYSPPSGVYYFRQGVFSQYNGRRLVAATRPDVDTDIAQGFPAGGPMEIPSAPPAGAYRSTVKTTVGLLADHTRAFGLEAPLRFEPAPNPNPERFQRTFAAISAVLTADHASMIGGRVGHPRWSSEQRAHYLTAPEDPRYRKLAERIVREVLPDHLRDDPVAKALAVQHWLSEKGTYSLESRHAQAEDPTAHFLFGDLTGYCVHFAHAATYLLRSLGLPARVATGYAVPEQVRQGGTALMLTGADSHAWPELYVDGYGWVVMDVQPEQVVTPPPNPPDQDLQRLLGELLRGEDALPPDAAPSLPRVVSMARERLIAAGWVLLGLLGGLVSFLFAGKLWRRTAPLWAREGSLARVVYRAELDRLSEVALRRRPGESREAFALRLAEMLPSLTELTRLHVGAAFGSRRALAEARAVRERGRRVRAELRRAVPWWRRALGIVAPWTWLLAR
ncbi:MAG: transglutaminase-like domain-containing protein [Myxococcota bacterium]